MFRGGGAGARGVGVWCEVGAGRVFGEKNQGPDFARKKYPGPG